MRWMPSDKQNNTRQRLAGNERNVATRKRRAIFFICIGCMAWMWRDFDWPGGVAPGPPIFGLPQPSIR